MAFREILQNHGFYYFTLLS